MKKPALHPPTHAFDGRTTKYGFLRLYVNHKNQELVELYIDHIHKHNQAMLTQEYPNSGFDLFVPEEVRFTKPFQTKMIDLQVKAEMLICDTRTDAEEKTAFYVFPRSSISKTPLMLANHTGVIDSGYRGFLMGAFRWLTDTTDTNEMYVVEKHTRLLQITVPTLQPVLVILVDEDDLSNTERGEGGFGSTGK
jgi:dUTP pyrophosphatase